MTRLGGAVVALLVATACSTTPSGTVTTSIEVRGGHEVLTIHARTTPETSVSVSGPGRSEGCSGPLDGTASSCTIVLDGVAERAPTYTVAMSTPRPRFLGIPLGSPGHAQQQVRAERALGATWSEERRRTVLLGMGGEIAVDAAGNVVLSGVPDGTELTIGAQRSIARGGEARLPIDLDPLVVAALVSTGGPSTVDLPSVTIAAGGAPVAVPVRVDPTPLRAGLVARARDVEHPAPALAGGHALLWVSGQGETELHGEARTLADLRYVALERVIESRRGTCGPYSQVLSAPGGARVPRIALDLEVWIVDRSTGAEVARRRFPGEAPWCPSIVELDRRSIVGSADVGAARAWLLESRPGP